MPRLLAIWLLASYPPANCAELLGSAALRAEVETLLANLDAAGCRFQRNGSWYSGAQARAHLARKWQEMERRQLARSTEQFIEQGASKSMLSGEPYMVQCGHAPAQPSRTWLMAQLRALRLATK